MRIAISNIAWEAAEEADAAAMLRARGVDLVEVAPTRVWPDPLIASADEVLAYRNWWEARGIRIVALQALLFARPDLSVFGNAELRAETLGYLRSIIALAARLGATALVFGSPKNRHRGALSMEQALAVAVPFMRDAGAAAAEAGVNFCIEPNPPQYGCDFITNAEEGAALARDVASPGFGLHLDTAAMHLAGDDLSQAIPASLAHLTHFHASAPFLAPVSPESPVDYAQAAALLRRYGYGGVVSIEMKPVGQGANLAAAERAVDFVKGVFGDS